LDGWINAEVNLSAYAGVAIRMSLEEGVTNSWLTGGLFKVNTEWPSPGSTRFQVAGQVRLKQLHGLMGNGFMSI
jgi:hypothetical protein